MLFARYISRCHRTRYLAVPSDQRRRLTAPTAHKDDEAFLDPLQFGRPDRMYAIPLVARGRGVAVMYADYGTSGTKVNLEALETLVRIAGVTVELLAASQTAQSEGREAGAADFEQAHHEAAEETVPSYDQARAAEPESQPSDFAFSDGASTVSAFDDAPTFSAEPVYEERVVSATQQFEAPREEPAASTAETFEPHVEPVGHNYESDTSGAVVFDSGGSIEPAAVEKTAPSPFETTAQAEPAGVGVMGGGGMVAERGIEVSPASAGHGRLSDRPVDLPIDVAEDERRLHNDARRFARLLVSEIKLYNEKKVQEGRQANDLYERLREAIDRSREMYDKRVQPPVASKFDYFHYELVNALADGDVERLGSGYPGSAV